MKWEETPDLERLCFSLAIAEGDKTAVLSVQDWLMEQGCERSEVERYLELVTRFVGDGFFIEGIVEQINHLERSR